MQALVFDFDGLILDTETAELKAWQSLYEEYGQHLDLTYWSQLIGVGPEFEIERPAAKLSRLIGGKIAPELLAGEQRRRFRMLMNGMKAREGVVELVEECRENGLPVAIASSSAHEWVDGFLAELGLSEAFDTVVCRDDAPRAKPSPDLYLEACARLGVPAEQAVALEDSVNGIRAAKAAGMFAVAIPGPVTKTMDFSIADHKLPSLKGIGIDELKALRG